MNINHNFGIFTGCDNNYFYLLIDLIKSIRNHDNDIYIVVIDGGIDLYNKKIISEYNNIYIVNPKIEDYILKKIKKKSDIMSYLRLNLDKICKEFSFKFKNLIWLDTDTKVQNLKCFLEICSIVMNKKKLAIKCQNTRNDLRSINLQKIINLGVFSLYNVKNILYKNSRRMDLSNDMLDKLCAVPTLNSGVFCLHINSIHWESFRYWQSYIIDNGGKIFSSDQLAIGYSIYLDNLNYELLPDTCNYFTCYELRYNHQLKKFVEFHPPYNEINIIHYCGSNKLEKDWYIKDVYDMNDKLLKMNILTHEIL